ncbi:hypothetical protein BDF22DRAFT_522896 [Syncephalis plumigaleata]|nr:hypothetical protein BDF22DRAFT_522896 [Syncephalis plumigaleata]
MKKEAEVEERQKKKKDEKMAIMMQGLDPSNVFNAKEKELRSTLISLESMEGEGSLTNAEAEQLRQEYSKAKSTLEQQEQFIEELTRENNSLTRKRDELEMRLITLEGEFEELLDKTIAEKRPAPTWTMSPRHCKT